MITAILIKVIPWWFGIQIPNDAIYGFATLSGMEFFFEIALLIGIVISVIQKKFDI